MGLRILSGVLVTRGAPTGHVTINFLTNTILGADPAHVRSEQNYTAGDSIPAEGFNSKPAHMVALRELKVVETEWTRLSRHEGEEIELFRINTYDLSKTSLTIEWISAGGSQIEEISYMIIGNV